jgi:hypothetical protein
MGLVILDGYAAAGQLSYDAFEIVDGDVDSG